MKKHNSPFGDHERPSTVSLADTRVEKWAQGCTTCREWTKGNCISVDASERFQGTSDEKTTTISNSGRILTKSQVRTVEKNMYMLEVKVLSAIKVCYGDGGQKLTSNRIEGEVDQAVCCEQQGTGWLREHNTAEGAETVYVVV